MSKLLPQTNKDKRGFSFSRGSRANAAILDQVSLWSGWLTKQGGMVKNWQRRWFELKGDQLLYFKEDKKLGQFMWVGGIPLPGRRVQEKPYSVSVDDPGKYYFEILPGENELRVSSNHETYLLCADSDKDRSEWTQVIRRVIYGHLGGGIFGQSLEDTMKHDARNNLKVPKIVQQCVNFLRKNAMEAEGIFRLPGRTILIKKYKQMYDCGQEVTFDPDEIDIHTAASLLKQFLRELPEPLITKDNYLHMASVGSKFQCGAVEEAVNKTVEILKALPAHNYNLLKYLCEFFNDISKQSETNKMNVANLGTVLGPNIARPEDDNNPMNLMGTASLTQHIAFILIECYDNIFKMEYSNQGQLVETTDDLISVDMGQSGTRNMSLRAVSEITTFNPPTNLLDDNEDGNIPVEPLLNLSIDVPHINQQPVLNAVQENINGFNDTEDSDSEQHISPRDISSDLVTDVLEELDSSSSFSLMSDELSEQLSPTSLSKISPSPEALYLQVEALKKEITRQKTQYESQITALKEAVTKQKADYDKKLNSLAEQLNKEKASTEQAVHQVMIVQQSLQQYQLQYGQLK